MNKSDIKWAAGIIDAEGSFSISTKFITRKKHKILIRDHRLRIDTTDDKIIPKVSKILGTNFSDNGYRKSITIRPKLARKILPNLIPLLHTKNKQAQIFYDAISIKNGKNTPYTKQESLKWDGLCQKLSQFNKRGKGAWIGEPIPNHEFNWDWFAGIVDGDGSITTAKFNNNHPKPFIKITMTNHHTIDHIASSLGKFSKLDKVKGNRRTTKTIRLMSNDIIEFVPKFVDCLVLKRKQAELAYQIAILRQKRKINKPDQQIISMLKELRALNNE